MPAGASHQSQMPAPSSRVCCLRPRVGPLSVLPTSVNDDEGAAMTSFRTHAWQGVQQRYQAVNGSPPSTTIRVQTRHVIVDEFQDLTATEGQVVTKLRSEDSYPGCRRRPKAVDLRVPRQ